MSKMNKKVKAKWIKALRSGKYRKTTNQLKSCGNKCSQFCCLGVLTDLYCKEKGKKWARYQAESDGDEYVSNSGKFLAEAGDLPPEVRDWAGLSESNPMVDYTYEDEYIGRVTDTASLASLNDGDADGVDELSFKEIAKLINKNL